MPETKTDSTTQIGVTLRSGLELSAADMQNLALSGPGTLVILAGPPDCGKTTLVSSLYELLRAAAAPGLWFAGSRTLVAFEQRSHLSRLAAGLPEPLTERTKYSDEQTFYHLRTCPTDRPVEAVDLCLLDVAGEGFKDLRTSHDACKRLTSLAQADFLAVLLDGQRLIQPATRFAAVEECMDFLQCACASRALGPSCRVQVVVTKADTLPATADSSILSGIFIQIRQRLRGQLDELDFWTVAARPTGQTRMNNLQDIADLISGWVAPQPDAQPGQRPVTPLAHEREAEAFAHRLSPEGVT